MVTYFDEGEIPSIHKKVEMPTYQLREGISFRFFRSLHNLFAFVSIEPGAPSSTHEHPWEQVVMAVDGETGFYVDGEEFTVEAGDIFFIPPSVEHGLRPRSDSGCGLFVIWPFREEYSERTAYQREFATDAST